MTIRLDIPQVAALLQEISAATRPYPRADCLEQEYADGYPVSHSFSSPFSFLAFSDFICIADDKGDSYFLPSSLIT